MLMQMDDQVNKSLERSIDPRVFIDSCMFWNKVVILKIKIEEIRN